MGYWLAMKFVSLLHFLQQWGGSFNLWFFNQQTSTGPDDQADSVNQTSATPSHEA